MRELKAVAEFVKSGLKDMDRRNGSSGNRWRTLWLAMLLVTSCYIIHHITTVVLQVLYLIFYLVLVFFFGLGRTLIHVLFGAKKALFAHLAGGIVARNSFAPIPLA
jgi:hypothetical protein